MKKLISILLVAVMLVAMVPAIGLTTAAATNAPATPPTTSWADTGNYDLSLFADLIVSAHENGSDGKQMTVALDGSIYKIQNEASLAGKTYYIEDEKQLAGLAKLSNAANADCFKFCVIYITEDLDLGNHKWVPISQSTKFRGSLVGAKGVTEDATLKSTETNKTNVFNNNTYSVEIKNMYIETTSGSTGLIGKFGGDWVMNINLTNAYIKANNFTVGSFVGWQDGNLGSGITSGYREGGYVNLKSDADIVMTGSGSDRYDDVGGIVGFINSLGNNNTNTTNPGVYTDAPANNPYASTIIDNCVFTGTINAPKADMVGGIIGGCESDNNSAIISNCIVISDSIAFGEDCHSNEWDTGFGGLAGRLYSNGSIDVMEDNPWRFVSVDNCYVAANLKISAAGKEMVNVGGIIGTSCSQPKSVTNCQFDGVITGVATNTSALIARNLGLATVTDNVITGIAFNKNGVNAYLTGKGKTYITTAADNFAAVSTKLATDGDNLTVMVSDTNYDGLDNTIWNKTAYDMPVLAIAVPYLEVAANAANSVLASGADLGWFNPAKNAVSTIKTKAELDGFEMLYNNLKGVGRTIAEAEIEVAPVLMATDLSGYSAEVKTFIEAELGIANVDTGSVFDMSGYFAQVATAKNADGTTYNIRFVTLIKGTDYDKVNFEVAACRNNNGTMQYGGLVTSEDITKCYSEVIEITAEGSKTHTASEGCFYVVCVIKNIDLSCNTTFTVRASATSGKTVTQSAAVQFVVPVQE